MLLHKVCLFWEMYKIYLYKISLKLIFRVPISMPIIFGIWHSIVLESAIGEPIWQDQYDPFKFRAFRQGVLITIDGQKLDKSMTFIARKVAKKFAQSCKKVANKQT